MDTEPQIYWCSYCGKDIWIITDPRKRPEDLVCTECKRILDSYGDYVISTEIVKEEGDENDTKTKNNT